MTPKKIFIAIIKNLIVLVIATFIFSSITLDFPNLLKGFFGDIFEYASPEVQREVVGKLAESCSGGKGNVVTMAQLCTNKSLLDSMKQDCKTYRELQSKGIRVENEAKMEETCVKIESGEIDDDCSRLNKQSPDYSKTNVLCKEYKDGKIDGKEFFYGIVASPFQGQQLESPQFGFLEKYNRLVTYLNNNKILYFVIIAVLLGSLYLLIKDFKVLLLTLGEISFNIGMIILLPYAAILLYDKFIGIDTTSILGSILGLGGLFDFRSIISVILLLFLRTYNNFIIIIGIILLAMGIAGKVYASVYKKKALKNENKESADELLNELERDSKKKNN